MFHNYWLAHIINPKVIPSRFSRHDTGLLLRSRGAEASAAAHEAGYLVQRLEPVAQLGGLSSDNSILGFNIEVMLRGDTEAGEDLAILFPELSHLSHQVVEALLLPEPASPSRLAVRNHALSSPLVQQ